MTEISKNNSRDVKDSFDLFDINRDGVIDPDDLKIAMRSLGFEFTPQEIQRFVMELDPNNSGKIDFDQYHELIRSKMADREPIEQIQMAFQMMDTDKSGKITFSNLKKVAKEIGETISDQELHEMINEADTDNDGEISFEEFVALIQASYPNL